MTDDLSDEPVLDDDALSLLDDFRQEEQIPEDLHQRVWDRLEQDVAAPVVPLSRGARWARNGAVTGLLAAAALAVLWLGGRVISPGPSSATPNQAAHERASSSAAGGVATPRHPTKTATPRTPSTEPAEPDESAKPNEPAEPTTPPPPPPMVEAETQPPTPPDSGETAKRSIRRRPAEPKLAPVDTLAEENRLLAKARAALLADDPSKALRLLREHAQRFAQGVLTEERKALRAVALCDAGRDKEGKKAARAFLRAHPRAALAPRVRSACLE